MRKPPEIVFLKRELSFTEREIDVLKLYARGKSHGEIGEDLEISPKTVGSYLQRIREKIRAKGRADIVAAAMKQGLLNGETNGKKIQRRAR